MRNGVMGFLLRNHQHQGQGFRHNIVRRVSLPSTTRRGASVTGTVYQAVEANAPVVTLFTKEGCTLCDKVKDVLADLRQSHDHSLTQVDITDKEHVEWFDKYKYDIPGKILIGAPGPAVVTTSCGKHAHFVRAFAQCVT